MESYEKVGKCGCVGDWGGAGGMYLGCGGC